MATPSPENPIRGLTEPIPIRALNKDLFHLLYVPTQREEQGIPHLPRYDFGIFKPSIQQMMYDTRLVYRRTAEERDKFDEAMIPFRELYTEDEIEGVFRPLFFEQLSGERGRIFYASTAEEINCTQISYGKYSEDNLPYKDVLTSGYLPLFEAHTHPDDSLFSYIDYARLVTDFSSLYTGDIKNNYIIRAKKRLASAIMVLCPSSQVLAVPTELTPLVSRQEAEDFVTATHKKIFDEKYDPYQKELISLGDNSDTSDEIFIDAIGKSPIDYLNLIRELNAQVANSIITPERRKITVEDFIANSSDDAKNAIAIERRIQAIRERTRNELAIEFARLMYVKLYMAWDFSNFSEFSA